MSLIVGAFIDFDLSQLGGWLALGLRLVFALVGGVIGWYLTPPVFRLLFRLAFQRPAPKGSVFGARLLGALGLGAILFLYAPGMGGGGFGFGGGGGWGFGRGSGDGPGKGKGDGQTENKADDKSKVKDDRKAPPPTRFDEVLRVELVLSKDYVPKSNRWYLLDGKEPALTLQEVEAFLEKNKQKDKGKFKDMDVILYRDNVYEDHPAVVALIAAADRYGLRPSLPREFWKKKKGE